MIFDHSITNAISKKTTPQNHQKIRVFQKIRKVNIFSIKELVVILHPNCKFHLLRWMRK